jgi:hypothetical protein
MVYRGAKGGTFDPRVELSRFTQVRSAGNSAGRAEESTQMSIGTIILIILIIALLGGFSGVGGGPFYGTGYYGGGGLGLIIVIILILVLLGRI